MSPHIGGALSINVRLSIRLLHQWLKCHSMQGNAVPVPPVIEIQRSHTSNFIKRSLAHNHLFGGGEGVKTGVQFSCHLWFSTVLRTHGYSCHYLFLDTGNFAATALINPKKIYDTKIANKFSRLSRVVLLLAKDLFGQKNRPAVPKRRSGSAREYRTRLRPRPIRKYALSFVYLCVSLIRACNWPKLENRRSQKVDIWCTFSP